MIKKFRKLIPHSFINYGKHLPEAVAANIKYGFPSRKLKVIGVTGTDGKTTTVNMIYQILKESGKKVSMISTINAVIGGKSYDTGFHVTSPDSRDIQKFLQVAVKTGDEFVVLEVTSHALAQFRVWGVNFEVGVITNITHEHLDYHKTWENYFQAKAQLIKNVKYAVLNTDEANFERLSHHALGQVVSFGLKNNSNINPQNITLKLQIPGEYNIYNALAAAAVGEILGIDREIIEKGLAGFTGLPGRMEEIKNNKGIRVFVDFAHTPNALENALKTLRSLTRGKLISVFGCASERDVQKRPLMGEISAQLADITVLTSEDSRFEDPMKIIQEITHGAIKQGLQEEKNLFSEPDREKAITLALSLAKKGDMVGIFGKGHEKSMNYQGVEKSWSDQRAVLQAFSQL